MRWLIVVAALAASPANAAGGLPSLIESCNWAVIAASGVSPKSAPMHAEEIQFCLITVEEHVRKHCPLAKKGKKETQALMWARVQAVGLSRAVTDADAILAACP